MSDGAEGAAGGPARREPTGGGGGQGAQGRAGQGRSPGGAMGAGATAALGLALAAVGATVAVPAALRLGRLLLGAVLAGGAWAFERTGGLGGRAFAVDGAVGATLVVGSAVALWPLRRRYRALVRMHGRRGVRLPLWRRVLGAAPATVLGAWLLALTGAVLVAGRGRPLAPDHATTALLLATLYYFTVSLPLAPAVAAIAVGGWLWRAARASPFFGGVVTTALLAVAAAAALSLRADGWRLASTLPERRVALRIEAVVAAASAAASVDEAHHAALAAAAALLVDPRAVGAEDLALADEEAAAAPPRAGAVAERAPTPGEQPFADCVAAVARAGEDRRLAESLARTRPWLAAHETREIVTAALLHVCLRQPARPYPSVTEALALVGERVARASVTRRQRALSCEPPPPAPRRCAYSPFAALPARIDAELPLVRARYCRLAADDRELVARHLRDGTPLDELARSVGRPAADVTAAYWRALGTLRAEVDAACGRSGDQ